jgi:hypothetical protein
VSGPLVSKADLGRERPIRSQVANDAFRRNYERTFGKRRKAAPAPVSNPVPQSKR